MLPSLILRLDAEPLAVCRLPTSTPLPEWAAGSGFCSATWTAEELSVVCPAAQVPPGVQAERGWVSFQVAGPLDFGLTGVLLAIAAPLATAGISLFAISTFDTDYVLVKQTDGAAAADVLRQAGHQVS